MAAQNRQRKVLRMAIIQDGELVQERVMKANEPVTIGESPKSTFVLPVKGLPSAEFLLFKPTPKGYALQVADPMVGKVQEHGGGGASKAPAVALKSLLADPTVSRTDGVVSVPLEEHHRGKITIGAITVLFQFVPPPVVKAVPAIQQMDFRPRLIEDDDPVFLGFLGIWSLLGIVLAIWVWRTEPRPFTLDDVPDRFVQLVRPPEDLPEPDLVVEEGGTEQEREVEAEVQEESPEPRTERERVKAERKRKEDMMASSPLLVGYSIAGTQGESSNGVVQKLWSDADRGLGDVDGMLSQASAASGGVAGTRMGNAGGTEAAEGDGIDQIGGGKAKGVAGPKVTVRPRVTAGTGSVDAVAGSENEINATVKQYLGQLRYCYESVLKTDPTLQGRVEVRWTVGGGRVQGMPFVINNTTDSNELGDCIVKKVRRWEFPDDVQGPMSYPFVFQPK